jgi:regulator of protease activity HflC (stomatin/prohibitin superfamily)
MVSLKRIAGLAVALVATILAGCTTIPPGYVGIKYSKLGEKRTIENIPILVGRVSYNPFTEGVEIYPVTIQRIEWSSDQDNVFRFNTSEGLSMSADVAMNVSVEKAKAAYIFVSYRQKMSQLTEGTIKDRVRDAIVKTASKYTAEEINGTKRTEFTDKVETNLRAMLEPLGFNLASFAFVGELGIPDNVRAAINSKIEATQKASQIENELRSAKAEAAKKIAEANGSGKAAAIQAQGDAEATLIKAKAEASANSMVSKSITPQLIEWKKANSWNGELPQVMTGNGGGVMLNLSSVNKDKG